MFLVLVFVAFLTLSSPKEREAHVLLLVWLQFWPFVGFVFAVIGDVVLALG